MRSILIIAGATALAFALPMAAQPSDSGQSQETMDTEGLQPGTYSEDQGPLGRNPDEVSTGAGPGGGPHSTGTDPDQAIDKALSDSSKDQPPRTESVQGIRGSLDKASPSSSKGEPPSTEFVEGIRGALDEAAPDSQKDQLPAVQQNGPQRQQ